MVWTDEQIAIMAGMKRAGLTNAQIAKRLNMPIRTVKAKASAIHASKALTHKAGRFSRWPTATAETVEGLSIA